MGRSGTNLPHCAIGSTAFQFCPALWRWRANHTLELVLHSCESEITVRVSGIRLLEAYRIRPFLETLHYFPFHHVRVKSIHPEWHPSKYSYQAHIWKGIYSFRILHMYAEDLILKYNFPPFSNKFQMFLP